MPPEEKEERTPFGARTVLPDLGCCESDMQISDEKFRVNGQNVNAGDPAHLHKEVTIFVEFSLKWKCKTPTGPEAPTQKCIGTVEARVIKKPTQQDVDPTNGNGLGDITILGDAKKCILECDGKTHSARIVLKWMGIYEKRTDVKGELTIDLNVPQAKGKVDHRFSTRIVAGGMESPGKNIEFEDTSLEEKKKKNK